MELKGNGKCKNCGENIVASYNTKEIRFGAGEHRFKRIAQNEEGIHIMELQCKNCNAENIVKLY